MAFIVPDFRYGAAANVLQRAGEGTRHAITSPIFTYYCKPPFVLTCCRPFRICLDILEGARDELPKNSPVFQHARRDRAAVRLCGALIRRRHSRRRSCSAEFGDWGAYTATPGGKKICFALAKPTSSETNPPNRPRDPAWLFVSTRPAEKVKEEVSVIFGYPFKANSDATIEIGTTNFAMYTQNDGAWVKNAAEEARLVDAMRKGADVTVSGESGRGTKTTDKFSLKGVVAGARPRRAGVPVASQRGPRLDWSV